MSEVTMRPLGEVADLRAGVGFPLDLQGRPTGAYPLAKVGDISRGGRSGEAVLSSADHFVDESDLERLGTQPIPAGSILFAKIGEAIRQNHRVIAGCSLLIDNNAMAAVPGPAITSRYLYHFLRTVDFYRMASATTVPALRKSKLEKIKVPTPPLPEQRRIAEVLDLAEALRAKRRAALALLDTLTQSIFFDMFGSPVVSQTKWPLSTLGEACEKITDGTHHSPPIQPTGIPYVTAKHLRKDGLDFYADPWFVAEEEHRQIFSRCDPRPGDVLYIKDGATTGIAAVNHYDFEFSMLSSLALLRPRPKRLEAAYLCHWLNNPLVKRELLGGMAGAAIRRLTLAKINAVRIPLPPLSLQQEFSRRVARIEQVKATQCASLAGLDTLFASLQYRAFRGEL